MEFCWGKGGNFINGYRNFVDKQKSHIFNLLILKKMFKYAKQNELFNIIINGRLYIFK